MTKRAHLLLTPQVYEMLLDLYPQGIHIDNTRPVQIQPGGIIDLPLTGDGLPAECDEQGDHCLVISMTRDVIEWEIGYVTRLPNPYEMERGHVLCPFKTTVSGVMAYMYAVDKEEKKD